jgi:hypothetical protein
MEQRCPRIPGSTRDRRAFRHPAWISATSAEFGVEIGEYAGTVLVGRRVFQHLLSDSPTPERCMEGYHLHRTQFEQIAERRSVVGS